MTCPQCLAPLPSERNDAACRQCGAWRAGDGAPPLPPLDAAWLPPEPDAKLRVVEANAERLTVILAGENLWGAVMIGAIFAVVGATLLPRELARPGDRSGVYSAVAWTVGSAVFCAWGLRRTLEKTLVSVTCDRLEIARRSLGFFRHEAFDLGPDSQAKLETAYERNYRPVLGVRIAGTPKRINFGAALSTPGKNWLVDAINSRVGRPAPAAALGLDAPGTRRGGPVGVAGRSGSLTDVGRDALLADCPTPGDPVQAAVHRLGEARNRH